MVRSVRASGRSAPHCRDPNSNNAVGEASVDGDAVASDGGRGRMTVHHLHLPQSWTLRIHYYSSKFLRVLWIGHVPSRLDYFRLSYGYTMRVSMRTYTYSRMAHEIYSIILFYKETSLNLKILIFNIQLTKKLSYFFHNFNRQFFL